MQIESEASKDHSARAASEVSSPSSGLRADLMQVGRGLCMGGADAIPGVSGGTVALILGIYERLVGAISHVDGTFLRNLKERQWLAAAQHIDLRFLVTLGFGIFTGLVVMLLLVNRLLSDPWTRSLTYAAFFGMILASAFLIAGMVRPANRGQAVACLILGALSACSAWWISALESAEHAADPGLPWLFACGAIAICAMILPGISGAMILLVLGVYEHLSEIPRQLLQGTNIVGNLTAVCVFAAGCGVGLICFSKVLKLLLARQRQLTMAALCGFMLGALRKLWPFQQDLTPEIEKVKHKRFELYVPETLDMQVVTVAVAALAAISLVLIVDYLARKPAT